jgi:hypothetical protein
MTGYSVYRDAGVAALFIVMYLSTIYTFIKFMREQLAQQATMIAQMNAAVQQVAQVCHDYKKVCEDLKRTLDEKIKQDCEFMAFLKGRDSMGGPRR